MSPSGHRLRPAYWAGRGAGAANGGGVGTLGSDAVGCTTFNGLIDYPHPETKINHFQDPSVVELLLPPILGIGYDDSVFLSVSAEDFIIEP
ncbi:hypothetical protein IQ241_18675 [Romeria aff. gracilis LEGE 07310]|uniref:Uncharacterized protein n=1 Tax=Vasconcelosia minhoensis LEGE 07310 TaxID=915328 RepID=A0A8J7DP89_9CYAN|nr:hypothetical protein [Romeria gracilis]MBE9079295.1 hypothetical protein [Romeria aff. gracilis LEGE 07310]